MSNVTVEHADWVKSLEPGDEIEGRIPGGNWQPVTVRMNDGTEVPIWSHEYISGYCWYLPKNVRPRGKPPEATGMTSADLADEFESFIRASRARVTGVGDEQYSTGEGQRFERMPIGELITMAREEAQDLAVYAAMIDIRLARLERAFTGGTE